MPESILIVDDDPFVLGLLTHVGEARGLPIVGVRTHDEAHAALERQRFSVAIVDLRLGGGSGLDVIKRLRARDSSIETIVISGDRRLSSALESFEQEVFAFIPKPLDPVHVFATVDRALERRRDAIERRRLNWELALLNEVSEIFASSLELDQVLERAIERVAIAFSARWAFVRLRPIEGGPLRVRGMFGATHAEIMRMYERATGPMPSDHVLATGKPLRVDASNRDQFGSKVPPEYDWKCTLAVPIRSGDQQLGVISLISQERESYSDEDEALVVTIGRQFGVAVSNGQLYERVHRAKVEWERTFDAISDPIAVFDSGSRTLRTNAALAGLRGWRITETQGRTCGETGLCGGGCPNCLVGRSIADGQRHMQEVQEAAPEVSGVPRVFAVTTLPVAGAGGVVLFARDMTEERHQARLLRNLSGELTTTNSELTTTVDRLRATQAQLVQSEKLSAIGQLVAGVAHELNNPLTSIIGYAQLVQEEIAQQPAFAPLAEGLLADIGRVLSESERAARIVRNLLTFARRQGSERSRTDVADLCGRVIGLRAYDQKVRNIHVTTSFAPDLPPLYVDDSQIQQALLNLILNAEQAMKDLPEQNLNVSVKAEPESSTVLITLTDNGHGIDTEHLARVFDPFFTTRGVGEGTGLGLSIVYGIVRDHGGQIWVESQPGETSFFIRLPARFDDEDVRPRPSAIVAHGDVVIRDFFVAALSGWGYSVRAAGNIREALAHVALGDADRVIVDASVVAPDPARWRDVWSKVQGRMALIALDASLLDDAAEKFLRDAAAVVLTPPFDLRQIRKALLATPRAAF
jgi:two-component system NtrC family sensor kinase